jgi:hypothetical protein
MFAGGTLRIPRPFYKWKKLMIEIENSMNEERRHLFDSFRSEIVVSGIGSWMMTVQKFAAQAA